MSVINNEPRIDDVIVISLSSTNECRAIFNIRVRMDNQWIYINNLLLYSGGELIISDHGKGGNSITGAPEAIIEVLPHKLNDKLRSLAKFDV